MATKDKKRFSSDGGVTVASVSGHPTYRWRVTFKEANKRRQKYFKKRTGKDGADEFAKEKREWLELEGKKHESISPMEYQAVIRFREILANLPERAQEISLLEMVEKYGKQLQTVNKEMSCLEVTDQLLVRIRKTRSKQHLTSTEQRLKKFNSQYGDWLACDVSTEIIQDFLDHLKLAPKTILNYKVALKMLFSHALKEGAVTTDPMLKVEIAKVEENEVGVFTPNETARILACADPRIIPALAISFFAGIRDSEISRLDWSDIDLNEGTITLSAKNTKKKRRRIVDISDNLKAWLLPHARNEGSVKGSEVMFHRRRRAAWQSAGLSAWVPNGGRHSFASYHLAMFKSQDKTATQLGHQDSSLLHECYKSVVNQSQAETYWSIMPADESTITNIKSA